MDITRLVSGVKCAVRALLFTSQLVVVTALPQTAEAVGDYAVEKNDTLDQQDAQTLHWVAYKGDVTHVRQLVEEGADVNARVKNGNSPLHQAAYGGHIDVSEYLIEQGAQVNAKTDKGITPLDWAKRNGHQELVALLIAYGAVDGRGASASVIAGGSTSTSIASMPTHKPVKSIPPKKGNNIPGKNSLPGRAYRIQLASVSSEQATIHAWATFRSKFPEVLAEAELIVDTLSLDGKQYYRVQTEAPSEIEARSMCQKLKNLDQPCFVAAQKIPLEAPGMSLIPN